MKYKALIEKDTNKLLGWNVPKELNITKGNIFVEIDEKVWQEALSINANCYEDGKFIVKDFRTVEELEQIRVNAINNKARDIIYSKYSQEKQSSAQLGIYGDEYLETMKLFIKQVIDISNEAIDNGTPADEVNWDTLFQLPA